MNFVERLLKKDNLKITGNDDIAGKMKDKESIRKATGKTSSPADITREQSFWDKAVLP